MPHIKNENHEYAGLSDSEEELALNRAMIKEETTQRRNILRISAAVSTFPFPNTFHPSTMAHNKLLPKRLPDAIDRKRLNMHPYWALLEGETTKSKIVKATSSQGPRSAIAMLGYLKPNKPNAILHLHPVRIIAAPDSRKAHGLFAVMVWRERMAHWQPFIKRVFEGPIMRSVNALERINKLDARCPPERRQLHPAPFVALLVPEPEQINFAALRSKQTRQKVDNYPEGQFVGPKRPRGRPVKQSKRKRLNESNSIHV